MPIMIAYLLITCIFVVFPFFARREELLAVRIILAAMWPMFIFPMLVVLLIAAVFIPTMIGLGAFDNAIGWAAEKRGSR